MFIVDPVLWALLFAGLAMPFIFRLVSEEVGAKRPDYRRGAIFGLCCMLMLWGLRSFAHTRALGLLDARTYSEENPVRLGAFPSLANPFDWTGVVETDSAFHVAQVNTLQNDLNPDASRIFRKADPSAALETALNTRTGRIFSQFARFPWAQVEQNEDGITVALQDLRFVSLNSTQQGFVATIELDKDLRVRSESFHFSRTPSRTTH
jgi:inner membrane protein